MTSISSLAQAPSPVQNTGLKVNASQQSEAKLQTTETTKAVDGGPAFASPVSNVDPTSGVSILVYQDPQTGSKISQYPSKQVVEQYALTSKLKGGSEDPTGDASVKSAQNYV